MNELDVIKKAIDTLSKNAKCRARYASELDNFLNRKKQAESSKYRLGVIGVTSSGKSTMINSLLGESLLPAVARPSSSQLVSCFHSTNRHATVYFQNGKIKQYSGNSLNRSLLEKYGDERVNSRNKENVKQIELSTPRFPFDDNIILIDSPGLDAYGYAGHEQLTMNSLLPTIDFCIFVTTCKTNSDDKMLSVLNTISEYEKPVIIVQNMIDSIKPSLDGKKSVADVAQDHRVRVERIINRSNINDKSKVHIVQISAINALKARQNETRGNEGKRLLEASNYNKLVSIVNAAFNQVRPIVEAHRMRFLKKEILRIAKAAKEDGAGAYGIVAKFQYEDIVKQYETIKDDCISELNGALNNFQSSSSSINAKLHFSENDICNVKKAVQECEDCICDQMRKLNSTIISICEELNIDSRNIITDFRFDKPELHLKKKTEVVKEKHWQEGKRLWYTLWIFKGSGRWIETSQSKQVTDVEGSIQSAINYINSSIRVFRQTVQRWQKSIEITENKLYAEIDNRRSEYTARRNQALDCQAYQKIGIELSRIAESIKIENEIKSGVNTTRTDVKDTLLCTVRVSKELFPMYKLSETIRIRLHNETFKYFTGNVKHHCIIGWDEYCEAKFIKYTFNKSINPDIITKNKNVLSNSICLIHKPDSLVQNHSACSRVFYILVNATQIGSALSEISRIKIKGMFYKLTY